MLDRRTFLKYGAALGAYAAFFPSGLAVAARAEVVVRREKDIVNLDPANRIGAEEENVIAAVCQNLVRFKPGSLEWEPDAAARIEQVSDTEIVFELRPGQMFHGGYGELSAEDVKFSFERFNATNADGSRNAYADDWAALDHVEVTGTHSGRVILKHAAPSLWLVGICDASGAILSKKAFDALGTRVSTQLIGSGPYQMGEWRPNEQLVLEANEDYTGSDKPAISRIVIKPITEPRTAELALQAGEIALSAIEPTSLAQFSGNPEMKVSQMESIDYTWLGLNVEHPDLADVRVRQAIRLAVDVDAILVAAYGGAERARSLLAPKLLGHWAEAPLYTRDVQKAQALLEDAGKSAGFSVTLTILGDAGPQAAAQIVQANLAEVGIAVDIVTMDTGSYWAMGADDKSKDLQLFLTEFTSKFDPAFQTQWFTSAQVGIWNWERWRSEEFDKLNDEAARTNDAGARAAAYVRMQQLMDESGAFIWLTHGLRIYANEKWLEPAMLPNGANWQFRFFREA
jgi:peptide/nickel transport system substrate-binding protein